MGRSEYVSVQKAQPLTTDVVHGHWDSRVRCVDAALAEDLSTGSALDTAIALDIDGELVVDIWGGVRR